MKKKQYIYSLFTGILLVSCSVEAPFEGGKETAKGELSKYALNFDASLIEANTMNSRAQQEDLINEFQIDVINIDASSSKPLFSGKYKDMPEVMTLESGKYKVLASYGSEAMAAFDNPYFLGESKEFSIEPNKITTDIGTILCKLENVKVSINFHYSLANEIDNDAYVEVKLNKESEHSLKFTKDEDRAGYFKHSDECTLVAIFHGTIDGVALSETKTLDGIQKGNHYSLTFAKHTYSADSDEGNISGEIGVTASVTIENLNQNITIAEDEVLKDDERPKENDPSGDDEEKPGEGNQDPVPGETITKPVITASEGLDLDGVNELVEGMPIVLNIVSGAPISSFMVHIQSTDSGFVDAVNEIIGNDFDLIDLDKNDGDKGYSLSELGFPVGSDVSNPEEKDENGNGIVRFEITSNLQELLLGFGGTHEFVLTITNEFGPSVCNLKLHVTKED